MKFIVLQIPFLVVSLFFGISEATEGKEDSIENTLFKWNNGKEGEGSSKMISSFEADAIPFKGDTLKKTKKHTTDGNFAITWSDTYISMDSKQDWENYDFLVADIFLEGNQNGDLYIEVRDVQTKDYWTRVNKNILLVPGKNRLMFPTNQIVGEKSRPGRALMRDEITRLVFGLKKGATVYMDNLHLIKDATETGVFKELYAFDFGTKTSPLLKGMTQATKKSLYNNEKGYGFLNAKIWNCYKVDVLQPDTVYRDFVNPESGDFVIDLPNGSYEVFINIDCSGGFWGEVPIYKTRKLMLEGDVVYHEKMTKEKALEKNFHFAYLDDTLTDNTFDKYTKHIFNEQQYTVQVNDGQLNIGFQGKRWAISLSCLVVYPSNKKQEGLNFLKLLRERRKADFENFFRRIPHKPTSSNVMPNPEESKRGYILFQKDYMKDVYLNDKPNRKNIVTKLSSFSCADEIEPLTFSLYGLKDLGEVSIEVSELKSNSKTVISKESISIGYVSNRIKRIHADGSTYTIRPRYLMNLQKIKINKHDSRRFWLNIHTPQNQQVGVYHGAVTVHVKNQDSYHIPVSFEVVSSDSLPKVDFPVGPWGGEIRLPWFEDEMNDMHRKIDDKSMTLIKKYGCNTFSTALSIKPMGEGKNLKLDFSRADHMMEMAKKYGMLAMTNYGPLIRGLNLYGYPKPQDPKRYGFDNLQNLYAHCFKLIEAHAKQMKWLPLYVTVCDEPVTGDIAKAAYNAKLLKPFSSKQIRFMGATSMKGADLKDPHMPLVENLDVASYNKHDELSIRAANESGNWSFYNGGNRWTFGYYMYTLDRKYNMSYRLSWIWNANAGNPFYALDAREDDYSWAQVLPDGSLMTSLDFERIREGIDDYRYIVALENKIKKHPNHQSNSRSQAFINKVLELKPAIDRDHKKDIDWKAKRKEIIQLLKAYY